jgi:hypothetical protein
MDIYFDPSKFGLEVLTQVDLSEPDYSFDYLVVWRNLESGKLFYATDSGCSCPSPFEEHGITDLEPFDDVQVVQKLLTDYAMRNGGGSFLDDVRMALRGKQDV